MSEAGAFTRERGEDGVLVITLDVPGEKVNTLGRGMIAQFEALLDEVEDDSSVRAVVVRSGKPDSFIAGADIKDFTRIRSAEEGEALSRAGHAIFDRIEGCRVPVVAAIHGTCLGGGTELALSCRYRVASDDPKTALGLPEVLLGLVPGAGGTQRLPRLIGLATALDLILTGRALKASRALEAGLVDEACPAPILLAVARKAALRLAEGGLRPRRPGVGLRERALRPLIFWKARSSVLRKTGGHYPAPLAAVDVVRQGTATSQAEGLKLEAQAFGRLAAGEVSRNLVSVFFATQEIKKDAGYPEGTPAVEVGKVGVLGAGLMGAGIAGAASDAGVAVRLKDASHEALGRGLQHVRGVWDERQRRRRLSRLQVAASRRPSTTPASGGPTSWSRRCSRTSSSSGGCSRRRRRPPATSASSRATRRRSRSATSRGAAGAPRRCSGCTSSRPSTRCRCSRSWRRERPRSRPSRPPSPSGAGSAST